MIMKEICQDLAVVRRATLGKRRKTAISDQHIITILEQRLLHAVTNVNVQVLDEILDKDLRLQDKTGAIITKEIYIQTLQKRKSEVMAMTPVVQIIKLGKDTASVSVMVQERYKDQDFENTFCYKRTWIRVKKDWKVIAGSCFMLV